MPTLGTRLRDRVARVKAWVGVVLLQRASRKDQGLIQRLCSRLLSWVTNSKRATSDDFMRDELVDAEIEFDPVELENYQNQGKPH